MAAIPLEEEDYWTELLQLIRGGLVVPVLGNELLQIEEVAKDLSAELGLPAPHAQSLNAVACRFLEERGPRRMSTVYSTLRTLLESGKYPVAEPLRKLAAIAPLQVFLTTAFDLSLEKALNEARYNGAEKVRSVAYSLDYGGDLPADVKTAARVEPAVVFHLFGLPAPFNKFALTDEDVLEYIYSLQSGAHVPEVLFEYVKDKHLLIIGSNFTDWLARFFIRSAKRERLWNARGREDFLADSSIRDNSFATFVQHFSGGMKVFSLSPVEFIDELHRRWMESQPAPVAAAAAPAVEEDDADADLTPMKVGSIFLSYASEDRDIANAIWKQLDEAKLDVWLDHRRLRGGEKFERVIRRNIDQASMVIALVSKTILDPGFRFFRTEWKYALKRAEGMPEKPPFVVPVSVDGTKLERHLDNLPEAFADLDYESAEGGMLSKEQIEAIVQWFVRHEKARGVGE